MSGIKLCKPDIQEGYTYNIHIHAEENATRVVKTHAHFSYNDAENDLLERMSSYYSCLHKTVKWCRKIVIELICETCLVNTWYIHRKWGSKSIKKLFITF